LFSGVLVYTALIDGDLLAEEQLVTNTW